MENIAIKDKEGCVSDELLFKNTVPLPLHAKFLFCFLAIICIVLLKCPNHWRTGVPDVWFGTSLMIVGIHNQNDNGGGGLTCLGFSLTHLKHLLHTKSLYLRVPLET